MDCNLFDDLYEYCTSFLFREDLNTANKKLVLLYEMNFLILSNRTVLDSEPSVYYISSSLYGIYIVKPIITGDITYQKDGEGEFSNKIKISVSGAGNIRIEIFHKGIKHKDPHPYLE